MKINLFVILFFLSIVPSFYGFCQDDSVVIEDMVEGSPYDAAKRAFSQLDFSDLETGFLIDEATWVGRPDLYKGDESDPTVDFYSWKNVYKAIRFSCETCVIKPDTFPLVQQNIDQYLQKDIIPVGIIDYNFDVIKQDAFSNGLLDYDSTNYFFYDLPRSNSPYEIKNVFVASPLVQEINSFSTTFTFPSNMLFNNIGRSSFSLYADFDDGAGLQFIKPGYAYSVNYLNAGEKRIKIQMVTDGDTLTSFSVLKVNTGYSVLGYTEKSYSVRPRRGSEIVKGTTYTELGCDGKFDKPIIVIEGFDSDNSIGLNAILYGYGFSRFQNKVKNWGYDVVIVNFDDATTYIENNAHLLRTIINDVNLQKEQEGSKQELIIVGASMGGLIARYELALMEKEGLQHKTKLYVSYDSPHKGAYIPLGLQYLMECTKEFGYIGSIFDKENDLHINYQALHSPAARQMLIRHSSPFGFIDHINFYSELNSNGLANSSGFPTKCRNIALIDGSNIGTPQPGLNANDEILDFENTSMRFFFKVRGRVRALPDNSQGVREICYYSYAHRVGLFRVPLEIKKYKVSSNTSFEKLPGGYEGVHGEVSKALLAQTAVEFNSTTNGHDYHSFVPSYSAACLNTNNPYFDFQHNDIYSGNITPFDHVYAKNNGSVSENGKHVYYKTIDWPVLNDQSDLGNILQDIEFQVNDLYLQNRQTEYDVDYEARFSITAGNNVTPEINNNNFQTGNFIVSSGTKALFKSGNEILFLPGFEVRPGGELETKVDYFQYNYQNQVLCDENFRLASEEHFSDEKEEVEDSSRSKRDAEPRLILYPNPASTSVTIKLSKEKQEFQAYLYNSTGSLISNFHGLGEVSLSTSSLLPGIYFIKVYFQNKVLLEKLMIQP